jgi:acetylglutamate/LysW-gamma-L-alpha-aminoadipate kinase
MIVLKIGGDIFKSGLSSILSEDIKKTIEDERIIIVHGGGDEVTEIAEKLGKKQTFITSPTGIRSRYTDRETIEIYSMVMTGRINKSIVRWLLSKGISCIGLSGIDAKTIIAKRKKRLMIIDSRKRKRIIEGGFTGSIKEINASILKFMLKKGYTPVVAPIAIGEEHEILNVDSDRAAANIAGRLNANKIIFLTDVPGILLDGKYLKNISLEEAQNLLARVGPGMDKKVLASIESLKLGAKEAIISSGFTADPITAAINHQQGTVIRNAI